MPWIVLIKIPDDGPGVVGDFVGVWKDAHEFSPIAQETLTIKFVTNVVDNGFSRDEIAQWLQDNTPERKNVNRRAAPADRWSDIMPEEKRVWYDEINSVWKFIEVKYKFNWNFADFDGTDWNIFANASISKQTKAQLFKAKVRFPTMELPENQVVCNIWQP